MLASRKFINLISLGLIYVLIVLKLIFRKILIKISSPFIKVTESDGVLNRYFGLVATEKVFDEVHYY